MRGMPDMDGKRATADTPPRNETDFPPYSLCGAVPLRHIHNKAKPAAVEFPADPLLAIAPPLLVYDGSCGFCSRAVQFILRHERRHDLMFVPRDSALGKDLRRTYRLEAVESLLWIADGQAAIESSAVLNAAKYLGGAWPFLAALGSICPAGLRNWGYRLIARNRRRLSSSATSCLVPTAEQRERFLG
jgi:predicted DCC family thiol-disulfide oxidoreductase YuxK